ncbi:MAG: type VI secretion system tip protein TssI/VgrG [Caulobacteraceae bacterium]|nr:type VI secretion system tip protein TssI/VgrG [Caulobacteraceae bacterium]
MVGAPTQDLRLAAVRSVLGPDALLLERVSAHEHLSQSFTISLNVIDNSNHSDLTKLLGTGVTVEIEADTGIARDFHGLVFEIEFDRADDSGDHYHLVLRPWTELLAMNVNSRIFQTMTALDIVKKVFQGAGVDAYQIKIETQPPKREYCVQFRESDFNFVSRLLEEEGLLYYFEHTAKGHTLIISDKFGGAVSGLATVPFMDSDGYRGVQEPHIWHWGDRMVPAASKVVLRDHHEHLRGQTLQGEAAVQVTGPQIELYDYPGGHQAFGRDNAASTSERMANLRLDAARAEAHRMSGEGDCFGLSCGAKFTLARHPLSRLNIAYGVIGITHTISADSYRSGGGAGGYELRVTIEAVPATTKWRPQLRTPKPRAGGPQTATVVGKAKDPGPKGEVQTDGQGRVRVNFHWDREANYKADASCWIRVSQVFASGGFGASQTPRVGDEVVVDFLEGDPDRPLITGRVYNDVKDAPVPGNESQWVFKSRTLGVTGSYDDAENPPTEQQGSNELRFEDKGGEEEVFIHAQRDYKVWVRYDETRKTGHDANVRIGRHRRTEIKKNEALIVEEGDETRTLKQGSRTTTIEKDDSLTLNQGSYTLTTKAGEVTIDAKQKLTLKCGSNTIVISPQGIEISGLMVKIKADTSLAAEGLTTDLKASLLFTISGLPVQIN